MSSIISLHLVTCTVPPVAGARIVNVFIVDSEDGWEEQELNMIEAGRVDSRSRKDG
jgi:hypothetical protein